MLSDDIQNIDNWKQQLKQFPDCISDKQINCFEAGDSRVMENLVLTGNNIYDMYFPDIPSQYNPQSPSIWIEFAAAAFRCHTFVRDLYSRATPDYKVIDAKLLWDISHHATIAWDFDNGGLDAITRGSVYDFGSVWNANFVDQIRHHLFETITNTKADTKRFDLPAMNINRARDHGINGYNAYREWCGFKRAQNFQQFLNFVNVEEIEDLKTTYPYVFCKIFHLNKVYENDSFIVDIQMMYVDLWVGINMENPVRGGLIGSTAACIIAQQFLKIKVADRFYYEHPGVFTPEQLRSIKSYPIRCFMCTTIEIQLMQPNPLLPPSHPGNSQLSCDQCQQFDLRAW
ncbi:unnamed protein product [Didymodactylos carnosus]|uniref:Uncharacterized protein n=1 Tax=Didymodactylos carnosus TaxID=1234261 RepID=A0A813W3A7_9BILA|nr:unnamed protein product [Didymodactylos carnosus]CAF1020732.1 unnamed protein product [Didymodactylos carnosus]CAF3642726.1 unnamed protein product [Didymodactylos carnosus]CAF3789434.1 unnamed protein product [Didymodactylos carnosus]